MEERTETPNMEQAKESGSLQSAVDALVSCGFSVGDIVRVKKETFHGKRKGRLAEVLGCNDIGWPRIKYDVDNVETLPVEFLELVCLAKMRSN